MTTIALPKYQRPSDLVRWTGVALALALAACLVLAQFDAAKECRGGGFSAGFSRGFDVRRCDFVVRRFGHEIGRVPLT
ncbi:hypothetical protein SAMN05443247_08854 [Bradyrhizobium erythrophlei]|nr:hypothetical protein SAMN05443247_08854 [Bradyrhizobium erythrophlei]